MIVQRLRLWARGHTRKRRYSPVGVVFHWTVAGLIVFQLWWGWRTGQLPVGADKLFAYQVHAHIGWLLLMLTVLRMTWRVMIPGPINDADKPGWQSVAAHLTHYALYGALLLLPLSGLAMISATAPEMHLSVGGFFTWPLLPFSDLAPEQRFAIERWAEFVHGWTVVGLLLLIPLHVGATLKHELVDRDDVLRGMLPALPMARRAVQRGWRAVWRSIARPPGPRTASGGD